MTDLFNAIVHLLNATCRATGLSYYEINILIYTFLIPATWWVIVWLRMRKFHWLWLVHLGLPLCYWLEKEKLKGFSAQFYIKNTDALLQLGGGTEAGYVQVSIIVGLLIPVLIYLALWLIPKQWLIGLYLFLIAGNIVWYIWVW